MKRKEINLRFKGVPLFVSSSETATCQMHLFFFSHFVCIFLSFLKSNLRSTFECNIECLLSLNCLPFVELFCELFYTNKCTTMHICKFNSIVTSSAPLISTSNAPSCASLHRCQRLQVQRLMRPFFCHLLMYLQWLFKVNSKVHLKCNVTSTMKCIF